MEELVINPLISHLSIHEEGDSVDLVAVEPDGALFCELNRPLVLPDFEQTVC